MSYMHIFLMFMGVCFAILMTDLTVNLFATLKDIREMRKRNK
ncbi:hypothetical protein OA45_05534 [Bacillus sp. UMTAT18]|nr:hypothetical protein [Bacillus sp. UMTAT18]KKC52153.1 hypothetical protein OA45_05534 [Bacillus sp. UMTAT18]